MRLPEIIIFLKKYNRWRRGDESIEQPDPKELGKVIDTVIRILKRI